HQVLVPGDRAVPEAFVFEEWVAEDETGEDRTERKQAERHEHRPRALVRVIARRAVAMRVVVRMMRVIVARVLLFRSLVVSVDRMLDVLALGPARLAEEGQENETPRVEARQQRGECTEPEGGPAHFATAGISRLEDRVLRVEPGEARVEPVDAHAGDR